VKIFKLNSDNFQDALVTEEAYREIRLSMSSGDFGAHTKELVKVDSLDGVITLQDLLDAEIDNTCPTCGK
jgi:hypothetical protein